MISSAGSIQNQAYNLMQQHRSQILEKLKSGETEESIVTGGNSFTDSVWNQMLESVDSYLEAVKEEQKVRFAKRDEEKEEKQLLQKRLAAEKAIKQQEESSVNVKEILTVRTGGSTDVPYGYLAKDGIIEYKGAVFVCDVEHHAICLGDMTNPADVLTIPLTEGGCLKVNRENIGELSKAISMFSPADVRRIMVAIAQDAKCRQMQEEMDETVHSISGSTTMVSQSASDNGEQVTAEQIAKLFENRET